jgi:probable rRNA maturation factor
MAYKVDAYVEPHYPLKKRLLVHAAESALSIANVKGKVELTVCIIGDRKMRRLNKQYREIDAPTDVLAFSYTLNTGKPREFVTPPSKYLNLGDVIISYPQLIVRAAREDTMVDDMASLLVAHGVLHLLGYGHEKPQEAAAMESLEDKALSLANVQN